VLPCANSGDSGSICTTSRSLLVLGSRIDILKVGAARAANKSLLFIESPFFEPVYETIV